MEEDPYNADIKVDRDGQNLDLDLVLQEPLPGPAADCDDSDREVNENIWVKNTHNFP